MYIIALADMKYACVPINLQRLIMEQITIKEVAKLCGVGVSTVSRAINNHPDINEETKKRLWILLKSTIMCRITVPEI